MMMLNDTIIIYDIHKGSISKIMTYDFHTAEKHKKHNNKLTDYLFY